MPPPPGFIGDFVWFPPKVRIPTNVQNPPLLVTVSSYGEDQRKVSICGGQSSKWLGWVIFVPLGSRSLVPDCRSVVACGVLRGLPTRQGTLFILGEQVAQHPPTNHHLTFSSVCFFIARCLAPLRGVHSPQSFVLYLLFMYRGGGWTGQIRLYQN